MNHSSQTERKPRFKTTRALPILSVAVSVFLVWNPAFAQPKTAEQLVSFMGEVPVASSVLDAKRGAGLTVNSPLIIKTQDEVAVILWDEAPLPISGGKPPPSVTGSVVTHITINGRHSATLN